MLCATAGGVNSSEISSSLMCNRLQTPLNDVQAQKDYFVSRTNFLTQFGIQRLAFLTKPGQTVPDFEIATLSISFSQALQDCSDCLSFFLMGLFPRARDKLQLQTPDLNCDCSPSTCKTGDFCLPDVYLSDEADKEDTKWALATVLRALEEEGIKVS